MGFYHTIKIDPALKLPGLTANIDQWQTKCLVDKIGMFADITLDADWNLNLVTYKNKWIPDGTCFFGGSYELEDTITEPFLYTGEIIFYNSYHHPEDATTLDHDFTPGWFEYKMRFVNGVSIGQPELIEHTEPVKFTLEETQTRRSQRASDREEQKSRMQERRKNSPSPVEKLIDQIDELTKSPGGLMPEMEDYAKALRQISETIEKYRYEHDRWYTPPTQG